MLLLLFAFICFGLGEDSSNPIDKDIPNNIQNSSQTLKNTEILNEDQNEKPNINNNDDSSTTKTHIPLKRLNAMKELPKYFKDNPELSKQIKDMNDSNQNSNEAKEIENNAKNQNEQKQRNSESNHNQSSSHSLKKVSNKLKPANEKDSSKKIAKFQIVSVTPRTIYTFGDEKIEIKMNTTLNGPPFIMFRGINKTVNGRHSKKDLIVKCRTPKLPEGEVEIVVSIDKVKWSEPYTLIVISADGDLSWLFVICASAALVAVILMIGRLLCGKRIVPKKKVNKLRNEDIVSFMRPSFNPGNLHKRTRIPSEV